MTIVSTKPTIFLGNEECKPALYSPWDDRGELLLVFRVIGIPQPGGSKQAFHNPKNPKRPIITEDNRRSKPWKNGVSDAGYQAMALAGLTEPLDEPLAVAFHFYFPRPKSHYGTGKNAEILKPAAPGWPAKIPDATKLVRGTEDALTKIVWHDDSRIVRQLPTKDYGHPPGVVVKVYRMKEKSS